MDTNGNKKWSIFFQVSAWLLAGVLFYFYLGARISRGEPGYLIGITLASFISYIVIIYGYVLYLYPNYFKKLNPAGFCALVALFFTAVLIVRIVSENLFVGPLTSTYETIFTYGKTHILYALTSSFVALIVAILLNAYLENIQAQRKLVLQKEKQAETQLQLLKSQLSPHFVFNTFNSLYYDTYKVLPEVADKMIMMSDLVRYFFDANKYRLIPVKTEIDHLKKLIALEKMRLHDPDNILVNLNIKDNLTIPPMLLFPFVENLFKHGVDEDKKIKYADISLHFENNRLHYQVTNLRSATAPADSLSGTGLNNLRKRLDILFPDDYVLNCEGEKDQFFASLEIPIYED